VKKTKQVGEVDPKAAIETPRIETAIHQRVVPLDHHEPFALETIHAVLRLSDPFHDQGQTTGQKPPTKNCRTKGQIGTGSGAWMGPIQQVAYPSLNHQYRQGEERAHAEPP
jgi:hypothetical protein